MADMEYVDGKISINKQKHMFGVAEFMYNEAPKYNLDPKEMYLLGLLHDVGYLENGWKNHSIAGSIFLKEQGYKYSEEIRLHDWYPGKDNTPENTISDAACLLMAADSCVDRFGENGGYAGRRNDIETHYGHDRDIYLEHFDLRTNFLQKRGFRY